MANISLIFAILFSFSSTIFAAQPAPSADEIARRAVDNAGGGPAWEKARYFAFTFNVVRDGKVTASFPQQLDRMTGNYRVSGLKPNGQPYEAIVNIGSKTVRGTVGGKPVTERAQLEELYELAYRRFINDMNWLLMPLELFYNGVHRAYEGERTDSCGHTWDVVKLTFDAGLGMAPGEVYYMWINRDTGLVDEWDIKVAKSDQAPIQLMFHDYRRVAGLLLSLQREVKGKNQTMRFDELRILPEVPKGAFE